MQFPIIEGNHMLCKPCWCCMSVSIHLSLTTKPLKLQTEELHPGKIITLSNLNIALQLICISCGLLWNILDLSRITVNKFKLQTVQWRKLIALSHPLYEGLHLLWCWLQESCHWCTLGNRNPWPFGFHCNWKTHGTNNVCQTSWVMIICSKLRQNICSWLQSNYHVIKASTLVFFSLCEVQMIQEMF